MPKCGRSAALMPARSCPSNEIFPAASGTTPEMALNRVVLPAPFGPTMATNSPALTSMETSLNADRPPYFTLVLSRLSIRHPFVAEIGFDDVRILDDVTGNAVCNHHAMVEHHEAVDEFHHRLHGVFDDNDRQAVVAKFAYQVHVGLDLRGREPRERLVEKKQARI